MDPRKRKRLEEAGLGVGSVQDFIGLTEDEAILVEIKVTLAREIRARRKNSRLTQAELAKRIGSTQPGVARIEQADASMDLLTRALIALGVTRQGVGRLVAA